MDLENENIHSSECWTQVAYPNSPLREITSEENASAFVIL